MNWSGLAGIALVVLSSALLLGLTLLRRKNTSTFREIPAFARLRKAIGLAVEEGSRLHISLGRGNLTTPQGAAELAGLEMLHRLSELTAASDRPPVATSGDGTVAILSQEVVRNVTPVALLKDYDPSAARLTGLTPFSYAAGVLPVMQDETVSTNVMVGNFGVEAALLTDTAERLNTSIFAGSDNLPAQAILYAGAHDPLIGEELYAAGAYLKPRPFHTASLVVQDILRWLIVAAILIGVLLRLAGMR